MISFRCSFIFQILEEYKYIYIGTICGIIIIRISFCEVREWISLFCIRLTSRRAISRKRLSSWSRASTVAIESKYPLRKMLSFAFEGITSLSIKPIELILRLGVIISVFGFGFLVYTLVQHLLNNTTAGWTSLIGSIWILGGLQIFSIGVIGKYIGKIYMETKRRPRYIIEENTME